MNQIVQSPGSRKKVSFSESQMASLNVLIDMLIPASKDGRMPSARSLDLFADISDMPPMNRAQLEVGLADLDTRAGQRYGRVFAGLRSEEAKALVEEQRAKASIFIQVFMTQTTGRYLADDSVMLLMGLEVRPPWPKGHVVTQGDWSLLDFVKKQAKIYRQV
jgi:Gluconate 2-dehydrogenase subunit 3